MIFVEHSVQILVLELKFIYDNNIIESCYICSDV